MAKQRLKVLITVKTAPIPSKKYDELVCTAGVLEDGTFVRLYPINFRDLPYSQQYDKYQWVEVEAERHTGRDTRKESWRPLGELNLGETLKTNAKKDPTWSERARYVRPDRATSIEALKEKQGVDRTSLGLVKPKEVVDLLVEPDAREWSASMLQALAQGRLWETREKTKKPPQKMPYRFKYHYFCEHPSCKGHKHTIEDWEVSRLFWRLISKGESEEGAVAKVKQKFLDQICSTARDTHFFVGTVLAHGSWLIIGTWWPAKPKVDPQRSLGF